MFPAKKWKIRGLVIWGWSQCPQSPMRRPLLRLALYDLFRSYFLVDVCIFYLLIVWGLWIEEDYHPGSASELALSPHHLVVHTC